MRKFIVSAAALAVVAVPSTAVAKPATSAERTAKIACKTERKIDRAAFNAKYGTNHNKRNAYGKCVSAAKRADKRLRAAAVEQCNTEAADANFASTHGGKTFAEFYGTNEDRSDALKRCVELKLTQARSDAQEVRVAKVEGAQDCRTERKADEDAFEQKYGTNRNKRNAFGKCVSTQAKAHMDDDADENEDEADDDDKSEAPKPTTAS